MPIYRSLNIQCFSWVYFNVDGVRHGATLVPKKHTHTHTQNEDTVQTGFWTSERWAGLTD